MDKKFIRVVQPFTVISLICLIIASALLLIAAFKRIEESISFYTVGFLIIAAVVLFSVIVSIVKTLKSGISFGEKSFEITSLDSDNIYYYSDIERVEAHKDTKASLKKNAVERYSSIILYLHDGTVATFELGITSKATLKKIIKEIEKRIDI